MDRKIESNLSLIPRRRVAVVLALLLGLLPTLFLVTGAWALTGPVSTPPGGVTVISSDPSGRQIGLGGITHVYTGFDFSQFETLYWGPVLTGTVGMAFDGTIDEPGEEMTFSDAESDLANGMARWTGTSEIMYYPFGSTYPTYRPLLTRSTLQVTDGSGDPVPLARAAALGLVGNGVALTVTGNFTTHLLFETYYNNIWQPSLSVFNMLHTDPALGGNVPTEFSPSFYYEESPITGLTATNDSPTPYGFPTTLTGTVVSGTMPDYTWAFGDGTSGSGQVTSHVYPAVGTYTAVVTASNSLNTLTATTVVTIEDAPITGLAATNDSPTLHGRPTTLAATVTGGNDISYTWAFGDGASGSGQVTTHTYPIDVSFYTATVTATNVLNQMVATTIVSIPFQITTTTPAAYAPAAPPGDPITATFNADVDGGTVNASAFVVRGAQTGRHPGSFTFPGSNRAAFAPDTDFMPGEQVVAWAGASIRSADGAHLFPYLWQFRAAVDGGGSYFVDSGQTLGSSNSDQTALADLDGDGDLDAFVANGSGQPNRVWTNDGAGTFSDSGQALGSYSSWGLALGDVDGDDDIDAFVGNTDGQPNTVWLNDGTGVFTDSGQSLGSAYTRGVALGDLDGDGDLDAFVANRGDFYGAPNDVWWNDGTGTFSDSGQQLGSGISRKVALGDLDNDGDQDAVVANSFGFGMPYSYIWLNDGSGTFSDSGQYLYYNLDVALGDLDSDGDLDIFTVTDSAGNCRVWLNDGTGAMVNSGQGLGNAGAYGVALGDLEGDGDLDAFLANAAGVDAYNEVWLNDGSAIFTDNDQALGQSTSLAVDLGDLDGDGDLDGFLANTAAEPNRVWFNEDQADVALTKSIVPDAPQPGEEMHFVLSYFNHGPRTAQGVVITDIVPLTLTQVYSDTTGAIVTPTVGVTYTWHVADLAPGTGGVITVSGVLSAPLPIGASFTNTASITSTILDGDGTNNTDTVTVTVANAPPQAVDDAPSAMEDSTDNVFDVLSNDSDPNGDPLVISAIGAPNEGGSVLNAGTHVTYTPPADLYGGEQFTYTVSDGNGGLATAVVSVTLTNTPDAPVANDDDFSLTEETPATVLGLLANDVDVDDDPLIISSIGPVDHGSARNAGTHVVYTPTNDIASYDTVFTYTVSDGALADTATVTVAVSADNDAPVADAGPDQFVDAGDRVTLDGTGSFDPEGELQSYAWIQTGGTTALLSDPTAATPTFTAAVTHTTLTFSLTVTDAQGLTSATDDVAIVVSARQIYLPLVLRGGPTGRYALSFSLRNGFRSVRTFLLPGALH